jgi:hypothetical protein
VFSGFLNGIAADGCSTEAFGDPANLSFLFKAFLAARCSTLLAVAMDYFIEVT